MRRAYQTTTGCPLRMATHCRVDFLAKIDGVNRLESIHKDLVMRMLGSAVMVIAMVWTAAVPARAQTYDSSSPVCLQVYSIDGSSVACGYKSLGECTSTASGRAAQCFVNPYFAQSQFRGRGTQY